MEGQPAAAARRPGRTHGRLPNDLLVQNPRALQTKSLLPDSKDQRVVASKSSQGLKLRRSPERISSQRIPERISSQLLLPVDASAKIVHSVVYPNLLQRPSWASECLLQQSRSAESGPALVTDSLMKRPRVIRCVQSHKLGRAKLESITKNKSQDVYCHRIPNRIEQAEPLTRCDLYNTDESCWQKDKLFHWGHLELHRKLGRQTDAANFANHVTNHITQGKEKLVNNQRVLFVASVDRSSGMPWTSMLCSTSSGPALLQLSEDGTSMAINLPDARKGDGYVCDKFQRNIRQPGGTPLCFLVIDYKTKNRARIRGAIAAHGSSSSATISNIESVGHCTRYIPRMEASPPKVVDGESIRTLATHTLSQEQMQKIKSTPSFYIGTSSIRLDRLEMSHRGGRPGFILAIDEKTIVWPEYRGNGQLSTLGNLRAYNGASLLLPFCDGSVLQMVGTCECVYAEGHCVDEQDIECHFFVQRVVETTGIALECSLVRDSAISPPVTANDHGINLQLDRELAKPLDASDLPDTNAAAKAEVVRLRMLLRDLKLSELADAQGRSNYNKPQKNIVTIRKGTLCAPGIKSYIIDSHGTLEMKHSPGQYINVLLEGGKNRYWTISGSPEILSGNSKVEITVKLEPYGRGGSKQLWDIDSDEGLKAEVLGIDGEMFIDPFQEQQDKKLLLLSSGIGITPFVCMARGLAAAHEAGVLRCSLDIVMVHSTRGLDAAPFVQELRDIASNSQDWPSRNSFNVLFCDTSVRPEHEDISPDVRLGRCNVEVLTREVPDIQERHVFICGSAEYTKAMLASLDHIGVPECNVQTEAFDF